MSSAASRGLARDRRQREPEPAPRRAAAGRSRTAPCPCSRAAGCGCPARLRGRARRWRGAGAGSRPRPRRRTSIRPRSVSSNRRAAARAPRGTPPARRRRSGAAADRRRSRIRARAGGVAGGGVADAIHGGSLASGAYPSARSQVRARLAARRRRSRGLHAPAPRRQTVALRQSPRPRRIRSPSPDRLRLTRARPPDGASRPPPARDGWRAGHLTSAHTRMEPSPHSGRVLQRTRRLDAASDCAGLLLGIARRRAATSRGHAPMRYSLERVDRTQRSAERRPVQDQILGGLEMLFGTPAEPGLPAAPRSGSTSDFDPNHPELAGGRRRARARSRRSATGRAPRGQRAPLRARSSPRVARSATTVGDRAKCRAAQIALRDQLAAIVDGRGSRRGRASQAEAKRRSSRTTTRRLRDSAELYRQQCLHCHGVEGGGDGPTADRGAPFLDPRPRDYRKGIFKFTAVKDKARPRREDLYRVLDQGVYGTAMPSFRRFSMAER